MDAAATDGLAARSAYVLIVLDSEILERRVVALADVSDSELVLRHVLDVHLVPVMQRFVLLARQIDRIRCSALRLNPLRRFLPARHRTDRPGFRRIPAAVT